MTDFVELATHFVYHVEKSGLCYIIDIKGGNYTMKKLKSLFQKIAPGIAACLTLVLALNANSSGCYFIYQPKAPEKLNDFKRFK